MTQPFFPYLVTGTSVLTEQIFLDYGGQTGTSTQAQRNAAYQIAEQFAIQEIRTFLTPTTVTGTFPWPLSDTRFTLPHTHVSSIAAVTAIHDTGCNCATDAVEIGGCAWLLDAQAGLINLEQCNSNVSNAGCACSCNGDYGLPLLFRVVYTAGLQSGLVAANSGALLGLVTAADLALEQITDPSAAEGGPGDPSLSSFSDTGYSESRQYLRMTAFGGSPRANFAARMLQPLKFKRALRLG